jgi:hypothetical protein
LRDENSQVVYDMEENEIGRWNSQTEEIEFATDEE